MHISKKWLLLKTPRYSQSFFKKLNLGTLGNPYEQLLNIFKAFVSLA
jgi:hypothetical protein